MDGRKVQNYIIRGFEIAKVKSNKWEIRKNGVVLATTKTRKEAFSKLHDLEK